ncbi:MAG: BlaI/MecI/CopY family transcriptional regulator [Acidobacteriota bacterium]
MARKKSPTLTDAELQVIRVLWRLGSCTVRELVQAQNRTPPLSYSSVATILKILHKKGHVRYETVGRSFRYFPVLDEEEAASDAVSYVVSRFFKNSSKQLVLNVLASEGIDSTELERLERLIESHEGNRS